VWEQSTAFCPVQPDACSSGDAVDEPDRIVEGHRLQHCVKHCVCMRVTSGGAEQSRKYFGFLTSATSMFSIWRRYNGKGKIQQTTEL
jgi:hypothetical protein